MMHTGVLKYVGCSRTLDPDGEVVTAVACAVEKYLQPTDDAGFRDRAAVSGKAGNAGTEKPKYVKKGSWMCSINCRVSSVMIEFM